MSDPEHNCLTTLTHCLIQHRISVRGIKDALSPVEGSNCAMSELSVNVTLGSDLCLNEKYEKFLTICNQYCSPEAVSSLCRVLQDACFAIDDESANKTIVLNEPIHTATQQRVIAQFILEKRTHKVLLNCYFIAFDMNTAVIQCLGHMEDALSRRGE